MPMTMTIIIFNWPGILMAAIAFGIAFGVGRLAGISAEGPLMIIAGPLCAAMDLVYRFRHPDRRWFHPNWGGALFFIPVWILGIVWLVLGIVYTIQGGGYPRAAVDPARRDGWAMSLFQVPVPLLLTGQRLAAGGSLRHATACQAAS